MLTFNSAKAEVAVQSIIPSAISAWRIFKPPFRCPASEIPLVRLSFAPGVADHFCPDTRLRHGAAGHELRDRRVLRGLDGPAGPRRAPADRPQLCVPRYLLGRPA